MPKKTDKAAKLRKFAASVRDFADSLPSAAEKNQLQSSIATIVGFLSEMERAIAATPSREDTQAAQAALRTFEDFIGRAKGDPALAILLGLPATSRRRPQSQSSGFSNEDVLGAQQLLQQLQELPVDIMKSRLRNESSVPPRLLQ